MELEAEMDQAMQDGGLEAVGKYISGVMERISRRLRSYTTCARCGESGPVEYRVTSDVLDLTVCASCAKKVPLIKDRPGSLRVEKIPQPVFVAAPAIESLTVSPAEQDELMAIEIEKLPRA